VIWSAPTPASTATVALSRVRRFGDMVLERPLTEADIKIERVVRDYFA